SQRRRPRNDSAFARRAQTRIASGDRAESEMVVRRQIERFSGHRLSVEAEALAHAHAHAETSAGRRPADISKTIAGAYPSPGAQDDDASQTGRVQHREGDRR